MASTEEILRLLAEADELLRLMPPLNAIRHQSLENIEWLGRATSLVNQVDPAQGIRFQGYVDEIGLVNAQAANRGVRGVPTILHAVRSSLQRWAGITPSVVAAPGNVFDYFNGVRKIVETARVDIFFVDPYLDADFISKYMPMVTQGTSVRLLASKGIDALLTAATLYAKQSGLQIEVREEKKKLHDRYIFVDGREAHMSTASFKDGGARAAASLIRITDTFDAVGSIYEQLWTSAAKQG